MSNPNPPSGAAVYPDPEYLHCAFCRRKLAHSEQPPQAVGFTAPTQVWCENPDCRGFNVVSDVPIWNLAGSKHRQRQGG